MESQTWLAYSRHHALIYTKVPFNIFRLSETLNQCQECRVRSSGIPDPQPHGAPRVALFFGRSQVAIFCGQHCLADTWGPLA